MRKTLTFATLVIGLLLVGAACKKAVTNTSSQSTNSSTTVTNTSGNTNQSEDADDSASNSNTNSQDDSGDNSSNTNRNTNSSDDADDQTATSSVVVTSPEKGEELESPFTVEGKAPSGTVYVRVKNAAGTTLFTESTMVREGQFKIKLTFTFTNSTSGKVEAFQKNADGTETNLDSVSVVFKVETSDDNETSNSNNNTNSSDDANDNTNSDDGY